MTVVIQTETVPFPSEDRKVVILTEKLVDVGYRTRAYREDCNDDCTICRDEFGEFADATLEGVATSRLAFHEEFASDEE